MQQQQQFSFEESEAVYDDLDAIYAEVERTEQRVEVLSRQLKEAKKDYEVTMNALRAAGPRIRALRAQARAKQEEATKVSVEEDEDPPEWAEARYDANGLTRALPEPSAEFEEVLE